MLHLATEESETVPQGLIETKTELKGDMAKNMTPNYNNAALYLQLFVNMFTIMSLFSDKIFKGKVSI